MHKILLAIKNDINEILPAVLYFLVTFNLLHLISGLILGPDIQRYYSYLGVSLEAIVIGKVIFIANALPFISLFPRKTLIYNILWKFIIYSLLVFIFWNAEFALHLYFDYRQWDIIWQHLSYILTQPAFWATEILALYFLLIYVIFHELVKAIGHKQVFTLLFKRRLS